MNFNNIKNVGEPSHISDVATKGYVDEAKRSTNFIAAHASYHGDLIIGEYQFTFGGSSVESYSRHNIYNGFLMPHSGYIKRFVIEDFGLKFNIRIDGIIDGDNPLSSFRVPLFSLVVLKNNESNKIVNLGSIYIDLKNTQLDGKLNEIIAEKREYFFVPRVVDFEKYKINTKDVLNIRSDFSSASSGESLNIIRKRNYKFYDPDNIEDDEKDFEWVDYMNKRFFTYLATILIELDPL